jgi:glutaredoxin
VSPRVVVYTKPGCHLCDDALAIVSAVCSDSGVEWSGQDISADRDLMAQWAEYVPVILVDGAVHDLFRVQPERLRVALSR